MTNEAREIAGKQNCPTCANREKVHAFDTERGDFWRCTADPILPAFTSQFLHGGDSRHINLASFRPDHPCAEYQNAKECPLWSPRAIRQEQSN